MIVHFSEKAQEIIANYFDNYIETSRGNDMVKRAYHLSRIRACVSQLYAMDTYGIGNRNYIDIDDICRVEYALKNGGREVLVVDIQFKNREIDALLEFLINY
ncbi:MAG: hypothetical protein LBV57_05720 [Candidatus Symbiothrix sp.]|jgi:hypothetical protein|nr:hypothetical protein [Candidatus Symbiothrix sp.]